MPKTDDDGTLYASHQNRALLSSYGRALRLARRQRRITQRQLAALVGIHQSSIRGIEAGYKNPTLSLWLDIQEAIGSRFEP